MSPALLVLVGVLFAAGTYLLMERSLVEDRLILARVERSAKSTDKQHPEDVAK